jgi:hypothetical protein
LRLALHEKRSEEKVTMSAKPSMSAKPDTEPVKQVPERGSYFSNSRKNWMALVEETSEDEELLTENAMVTVKTARQPETKIGGGKRKPHKGTFQTAPQTHSATIGGGALLSAPSDTAPTTTTAPMFVFGKDSSDQGSKSSFHFDAKRSSSSLGPVPKTSESSNPGSMNIFGTASRTHSATIGGGALLSEPSGKTFMVHPHVAPEAEQPEEKLEDFPETQRQADLFRTAVIHRIVNDETILGQVEDIEQHKVTKEKLYRIKYMDGYQECLTANQMREGMVTCNPLDLVYGIIAERYRLIG